MINFTSKDRYDFADLQRLVEVLRAPGGCPWDGAQTHLSIRRNFLEEAYEACEGFDLDDASRMREELGDVLLQVLFHTDIERAAGRFDLNDVCDAECKKLIFRHPALFGGEAKSWDEVKQQEKGQTTVTETLDGVARSLPATWRSEKIQKKAAKCGFGRQFPTVKTRRRSLAICCSPRSMPQPFCKRTRSRRFTGHAKNLSAVSAQWNRPQGRLAARWTSCPARSFFLSGPRRRPVRRKAMSKLKQRLEKRNCHE